MDHLTPNLRVGKLWSVRGAHKNLDKKQVPGASRKSSEECGTWCHTMVSVLHSSMYLLRQPTLSEQPVQQMQRMKGNQESRL